MSTIDKSPTRRPWTIGEKLLSVTVLLVVFGAGLGHGREQSLNADPVVRIPTVIIPNPNGYDWVVRAMRKNSEPACTAAFGRNDPPALSPTADDVATIARDAPAFADIRQCFQYPIQLHYSSSIEWLGERLGLESIGRTLRCKAAIEAIRKQWDDSVASGLDAVVIGESIEHGAAFGTKVTGNRMAASGRMETWTALPHLDRAAARADALRLWHVEVKRMTLAESLEGARYQQVTTLLDLMRDANWRSEVSTIIAIDAGQPPRDFRVLSKQQLIDRTNRSWDEAVSAAERPYPQPMSVSHDYMATPLGLVQNVRLTDIRDSTENRLLATALALQAYRCDHTAYPTALSTLCPTYLPVVPSDPFGGAPLVYHASASSYQLYSVGPDGRDDGGHPILFKNTGSPYAFSDDARGDIVAGVNL